MQPLTLDLLPNLNETIRIPRYDPMQLKIGVLHFGLGAFHRAHQAEYIEDHIEAYLQDRNQLLPLGVCGISLRHPKSKQLLSPQDGLFSLTKRDNNGDSTRIIGCLRDVLFAPSDSDRIHRYLKDEKTHTILLTVTEKGYCHHPATGKLQTQHADIIADWEAWETLGDEWKERAAPKTVIGWLACGLLQRKSANLPAFDIISCDNLPGNGKLLRDCVLTFSKQKDPELADWIATQVNFPSTMVDRITPAITAKQIQSLNEQNHFIDQAALITEPYRQWVIENQLTHPTYWSGCELATDVTPFEIHKLRLLNGSHSALAYAGYLCDYQYIHQAINDSVLYQFIVKLMQQVMPSLPIIPGFNVNQYKTTIINRFQNPALNHKTHQIAMDGSQKLPQRLLHTLQFCLINEYPCYAILLVIAIWAKYITGIDKKGDLINVQDPLADEFRTCYLQNKDNPKQYINALLEIKSVFNRYLIENNSFREQLVELYIEINKRSIKETINKKLSL